MRKIMIAFQAPKLLMVIIILTLKNNTKILNTRDKITKKKCENSTQIRWKKNIKYKKNSKKE